MLSNTEKINLENYDSLSKKDKANLNYRVANKIEKILSELEEVNEALGKIPEKTARRAFNDKMVVNIFVLTENILRILRFSPVGLDPDGTGHVIRFGPGKQSKDGITEFTARMEPATATDVKRHFLVDDHIKTLHRFIDLSQVTLPSSLGMPLRPLDLTGVTGLAVSEGYDQYSKLGRKGLGPYSKQFGFK